MNPIAIPKNPILKNPIAVPSQPGEIVAPTSSTTTAQSL